MLNKKRREKREGAFSLPDLLIIVGLVLIAGFSILVFVDPVNIQKRNRDITRLENLDALNRAIHLALLEGEITLVDTTSCEKCNSMEGSVLVDGTGWVMYSPIPSKKGLKKYLDDLPVDPINKHSQGFVYKFISTHSQGYKLATRLESLEHQVKMRVDGGIYDDLYEVGTDMSLEF